MRVSMGMRVRALPLAIVIIIGIVFGSGLLSPHGRGRPARAQEVDRAAIVQKYIDAVNAGDIDAAMATFTANALVVGPVTCTEASPCIGSDAIRRSLQTQASIHLSSSVNGMQVSGSAVTGRLESTSPSIRSAGVDRLVRTFIAQIPQDKITDWLSVPDNTDPQTAKYAAAQQALAPQALAPDPEPGPYAVGVTRRTFVRASSTTGQPRYLNTVIWYPADASAASLPRTAPLNAPLDAAPDGSGAPYPVILWSHGSTGQPWNSTFFTTHLASYGFVVIAPPHPGNTTDTCPIPCVFSNPAFGDAWLDSLANRSDDISFTLDQALSLSATDDAILAGLLDGQRVGVAGWSFGGSTVLAAVADDSRFLAGVAMAPGATMNQPIELQQIWLSDAAQDTGPMMVMSGMLDANVPFQNQQDIFNALPPSGAEHIFVVFPHTGHPNFANFCLRAQAAGCRPGDLPLAEAHLRINRWATAFLLRYVAGDVKQAAALDAVNAQDDPEVVVTRGP